MKQDIPSDYLEKNRDSWNRRTEWHVGSEFHAMESFLKGVSSLRGIELALLGDISGRSVLHLQCNFGQDTLSLARMGAKATGVDLSDKAIETARHIARTTGIPAEFICCDGYDLSNHLDRKFDLVFTALINNGLVISDFQEYDYSPYACFANLIEEESGKYRFAGQGKKIPMVYSLVAEKANV